MERSVGKIEVKKFKQRTRKKKAMTWDPSLGIA